MQFGAAVYKADWGNFVKRIQKDNNYFMRTSDTLVLAHVTMTGPNVRS